MNLPQEPIENLLLLTILFNKLESSVFPVEIKNLSRLYDIVPSYKIQPALLHSLFYERVS